jgi:hypothetical protein
MKLTIHIPLLGAGARELLKFEDVCRHLKPEAPSASFAHDDPVLERVLRISASGPGLTIVPEMAFSKGELESADRCQPLPRRFLTLAKSDFDPLLRIMHDSPVRSVGGRLGKGVRVVDSLTLSSLKLGRAQIASVSEGLPEHVVRDEICSILEEAGCSGWSGATIPSRKTGDPLTGGVWLRAPTFSGPAAEDPTLWEHADDGRVRFACCMIFPAASIEGLPDLARTSEPLEINEFPAWITSQRVRSVLEREGIKDWRWRPVLKVGSEIHRRYLDLWRPLFDLFRLNPRHRF